LGKKKVIRGSFLSNRKVPYEGSEKRDVTGVFTRTKTRRRRGGKSWPTTERGIDW